MAFKAMTARKKYPKIKKDDKVIVMVGKERGKIGTVLKKLICLRNIQDQAGKLLRAELSKRKRL